ncbi:MAG: hypothetical protein GAK35_00529 [Herbaspirillum frisingense]|uniref:DUF2946 domain-containing protein n=1 Tax=Herbaspirillum frisingense TaxID=92645 RepID=A0A7V8FZQ1_9BURK|nr:MAG: hypothetical protein GAK35_00529 [Herbaspirillum frisingense]
MSSRQPAPRRTATRRLVPRALLCLSLALAMLAAPWWQQAMARNAPDVPAMAICSVGNAGGSGGAPLHAAAGHCQLCCGNQAATPAPPAGLAAGALPGISYPLAALSYDGQSASPASGSPQARGPPMA